MSAIITPFIFQHISSKLGLKVSTICFILQLIIINAWSSAVGRGQIYIDFKSMTCEDIKHNQLGGEERGTGRQSTVVNGAFRQLKLPQSGLSILGIDSDKHQLPF